MPGLSGPRAAGWLNGSMANGWLANHDLNGTMLQWQRNTYMNGHDTPLLKKLFSLKLLEKHLSIHPHNAYQHYRDTNSLLKDALYESRIIFQLLSHDPIVLFLLPLIDTSSLIPSSLSQSDTQTRLAIMGARRNCFNDPRRRNPPRSPGVIASPFQDQQHHEQLQLPLPSPSPSEVYYHGQVNGLSLQRPLPQWPNPAPNVLMTEPVDLVGQIVADIFSERQIEERMIDRDGDVDAAGLGEAADDMCKSETSFFFFVYFMTTFSARPHQNS